MSLFSDRLKEQRLLSKMTIRDVAAKIGTSHGSYLRWEQGKTEPKIENIKKLCRLFDVSTDYMFGFEDETGRKV